MKSFLKSFSKKMSQKELQAYTEASLFPVLTSAQLVPRSDQKSFLGKLNETIRMPVDHFEALYSDLLSNFIEFVQILPTLYGGPLGGLIFEGMHRSHLAVKLLFDTSDTRPDHLYTYAVFSMSLLLDVNRAMASQKAMISNEQGNYICEWCPFNGSMVGRGDYYKLREYHGHRETFLNSVNPILAQSLLPEIARGWLSSDSDIFDMWIAVLTGHEEWAGSLGHLLQLLKKLMQEMGMDNINERVVDVEGWVPPESEDAEKFLAWLKESIEDGTLSVNKEDSLVHVLDEGLWFNVPEIYHAFNNTYASFRDWTVLQMHFNNLGLPMLSGYDYKHMQYFAQRADAGARLGFMTHHPKEAGKAVETNGMIIKDKGLLLKDPSKYERSAHMKGAKIQVKQSAQLPDLAGSMAQVKNLNQPPK